MTLLIRTPMVARATDEPHRASSQLELLFDLTFVIAIASLARYFAGAIGRGDAADEIVPFLQVFFAIWWAWVNFTWFASAFDTDDVPFRLLTLVQMAGVLVLAAGVPAALDHSDYRAVTIGYAIMRVGLVAHWLRAAFEDPTSRSTALRYAAGITVAEFAWISRLLLDEAGLLSDSARLAAFVALVLFELAIPVWAERKGATAWHPQHIAERYGLFAIILLGESVFAASSGVESAVAAGGFSLPLVAIGGAGLVLVFALWWLYFLQPAKEGLVAHRERSFIWGYGHYGLLAALAAISAGLEIAVEQTGHHVAASPVVIGYALAIPVAIFVFLTWALHSPIVPQPVLRLPLVSSSCLVILLLPIAAGWVGEAVVLAAIAATCASVVAITLIQQGDRS
ncbi:low temperature requirement protein A [Solirubrobacter ginsenosidimutans]|uniref:Low temperature requirement protein A n=1 Tax=Solirubrobacter ginsenosidimutans TaxID=490573 RepID=A0A9X3S1R9_9ACTN|nr:low temperature requirement protein A [Solirubrobacter ginsenosidimutans]MDA0160381.1 low temperature requirement protein A [Solirubrobacter ginsenosidimutans]